MKIFSQKSFIQKMIITLVIVILFNFIAPNISRAKDDYGGVLFKPIQALLCGLGDSIMILLGKSLTGTAMRGTKTYFNKFRSNYESY